MLRLKNLRVSYGFSRDKVAEMLGISPLTYRSYEQGVREPDVKKLKALSHIFNCSIDYLVENDREKRL